MVVAKNVPEAERKLLELPGLKKYLANLRSAREQEWFRRHLRKYVQIYHPDCPFEVTTTNRYIITEHEAAICARKPIKANQEIKFLSGTLVSMTKEEELDLGLTRKDFSVVMSSRRKTPSFFLGPARFANHDCDANGRLVTRGNEGMSVMATRDIDEGEEITVSYGDDYFGIDNCECLCLTCERLVRNGWAAPGLESNLTSKETSPMSTAESTPTSGESSSRGKKRRLSPEMNPAETPVSSVPSKGKKRRLSSEPKADDGTPVSSSPRKRAKFSRQTSKLREEISMSDAPCEIIETTEFDTPSIGFVASPAVLPAPTADGPLPSKLKQEIVISETVESTPETSFNEAQPSTERPSEDQDASRGQNTEPPGPESPSSAAGESHRSSTSSIPTSVDDGPKPKMEEPPDNQHIDPETLKQPDTVNNTAETDSQEKLSELSDSLDLDDTLQTVVDKSPQRTRRKFHIVASVETEAVARIPGDYTKTSRLLAQKYDRWVECQTCDSWFVQSNSYQTRRECPRCERHSKLYGFQWPKTEGRDRVMDHRTIHRFLSPDSEARVSRRDRGVSLGVTPTPDLSDAPTETDHSEAPESRRSTRSSRRWTRGLRMTM